MKDKIYKTLMDYEKIRQEISNNKLMMRKFNCLDVSNEFINGKSDNNDCIGSAIQYDREQLSEVHHRTPFDELMENTELCLNCKERVKYIFKNKLLRLKFGIIKRQLSCYGKKLLARKDD